MLTSTGPAAGAFGALTLLALEIFGDRHDQTPFIVKNAQVAVGSEGKRKGD